MAKKLPETSFLLHDALRVLLFQVLTGLWLAEPKALLIRSHGISTPSLFAWSLMSGRVRYLLDRVFHHGRVIDFLNLGFDPLRTGILNVADVCITIGVALSLLISVRQCCHVVKG